MARNTQVTRILRVLHHLELNPRGITIANLFDKISQEGYQSTERTIHRDLQALEDARFPVINEKKDELSLWRLDKVTIVTQKISFTYQDLLAFYIAYEQMDALKETPLYEPLLQIFSKFEKMIGPNSARAREEFKKYLVVDSKLNWNVKIDTELFNAIHTACEEGDWITFDYESASKASDGYKNRKLGPEAIYFADNGAYLVGFDPNSKSMKTFSLARMKNLIRLDEAYKSQNLDISEYFRNSFGILNSGTLEKIRVQIQNPLAKYISERRWHQSQLIEYIDDGIITYIPHFDAVSLASYNHRNFRRL
jgi:predicted DNA-binding transcriptional regulator YafY